MDVWAGGSSSVAAGAVHGDVTVNATHVHPGPPPTALAPLPPLAPGFTGRAALCEEVLGLLDPAGEPVPVALLAGLPGVGKTTLAVAVARAAHDRGWFDAVLFQDLRGYDPAPPGNALDTFLRALGVPAAHLPPGPAAQAALYRSRLHDLAERGRRVLVVADNASEAEHVRPLLPGPGPHRVLATSRETLVSIGARLVEVPVLASGDSVGLLGAALRTATPADTRLAKAPGAADELAGLCGHLPLALQIAAALLVLDPGLTVAALNAELARISTRLEHLDDGERAVRSSFRLSHRRLDAALAELFELLAVQPGPDIATAAAAVLAGRDAAGTRRLLVRLARTHLVEQEPAGRWRMHDLIRAYAVERARERPDGHAPALERLTAHYTATARAADHHLRALPGAPPAREAGGFDGREQALAWLDTEEPNVVATVAAAHAAGDWRTAHDLSLDLQQYFELRHRLGEWVATTELSVDAARHLAPLDLCSAMASLGNAYRAQGRYDEAVARLEEALAMAEGLDRPRTTSAILHNLGLSHFRKGRYGKAAACHLRDRRLCAIAGDRRGEAQALAALGDTLRGQRRWIEAFRTLSEVIEMFRELDDRGGLALAQLNLALVSLEGRAVNGPAHTIWLLCSALRGGRETGARAAEALAYLHLGPAYMSRCPRCHGASAVLWARRALTVSQELGNAGMRARALFNLGHIRAHTGDSAGARAELEAARDAFAELGLSREVAAARSALAHLGKPKPTAHNGCESATDPDGQRFVTSWLEDLPHAVLRGDVGRLEEVAFFTPGAGGAPRRIPDTFRAGRGAPGGV
jgi:tetratricopeptide (TPR) repeat protein